MADIREIRMHIKSIQDTEKVTNAMYMIAATKMNKAKAELDKTRPYFEVVRNEIKRVFRVNYELENKYFYPLDTTEEIPGENGYLIITGDRGLAGSYNQEVIKTAEAFMKEHGEGLRFVIGEYGRRYYQAHDIPYVEDFKYSAQHPSTTQSRTICAKLMNLYRKEKIAKLYVIYTDFHNGAEHTAEISRLLPFHRSDFESVGTDKEAKNPFIFYPSIEDVLENMVTSYISGFIYSALVDSFCCELNSRMSAMDIANKNADDLLAQLRVTFNHLRQNKITQEITEITSGARALKKKKQGKKK